MESFIESQSPAQDEAFKAEKSRIVKICMLKYKCAIIFFLLILLFITTTANLNKMAFVSMLDSWVTLYKDRNSTLKQHAHSAGE
jgi:hypothetical protein